MRDVAGFDIARWHPPQPVRPRTWWRRVLLDTRMLVGRSLFPILTLIVIGGTIVWGPWVTLVLAVLLFTSAVIWA